MRLFDEFAVEISNKLSATQEKDTILEICRSINKEVAQKQKVVIMLELLSVIMADGNDFATRAEHCPNHFRFA
jgi:hypothetical protein